MSGKELKGFTLGGIWANFIGLLFLFKNKEHGHINTILKCVADKTFIFDRCLASFYGNTKLIY
ncbi:MAG: hypothetical protein LBD84_02710 [Campylobacteraceae bacterium]|jgi:hypothetical protein|nr:hypothetical protein [Campylobacteraceae bacterium]